MKTTELRIGNYIKGIYETEIDRGNGIIEDAECFEEVRVVGLDSVNFSEYSIWVEDGSREIYDSFEGIPLTEEWLIKFGFESIRYTYNWGGFNKIIYYHINKDDLHIEKSGFDGLWDCIIETEFIAQMKYVHQLQNLYFSLTNKELEII